MVCSNGSVCRSAWNCARRSYPVMIGIAKSRTAVRLQLSSCSTASKPGSPLRRNLRICVLSSERAQTLRTAELYVAHLEFESQHPHTFPCGCIPYTREMGCVKSKERPTRENPRITDAKRRDNPIFLCSMPYQRGTLRNVHLRC